MTRVHFSATMHYSHRPRWNYTPVWHSILFCLCTVHSLKRSKLPRLWALLVNRHVSITGSTKSTLRCELKHATSDRFAPELKHATSSRSALSAFGVVVVAPSHRCFYASSISNRRCSCSWL
jgi:hypothetical protein